MHKDILDILMSKALTGLTTLILLALLGLYLMEEDHTERVLRPQGFDDTCGFTEDFSQFIKDNKYDVWNFDRPDIHCAAFGGKSNSKDKINNTPVIFVHGNSDIGFGDGSTASWQTGFRQLATYLGTQGYSKSELYTTTWGPAKIDQANMNNHKKSYVLQMRAFVEAVLAYTKASHVNVVSHSMGVTIARKIIQGGQARDQTLGYYDVGPSLKEKVKNFVGLAGGNLGLTACWTTQVLPACSNIDGFYPGVKATSGPAKFLAEMNAHPGAEGQKVYTIWSQFDTVVGEACVVWGKVTCRIPGQTHEIVKKSAEWGHLALRDNTGPDIINWFNQE